VADLPTIVTAEVQVAAAATAAALPFAQTSRQQWIGTGEQASPTLTRHLKTTLTATPISSLVGLDGQDTSDPDLMATNMVHYWEVLSNSAGGAQPGAMAQVLQALLEHSPVIQPHNAANLGASLVSEIEVLHAMRTSKPKSAAGVDGIELKLYRKFSDFFVPLFQRMFSVIGTKCVFPLSFSEGVITTVHKTGPISQPGNYRPLTQINTDYRLLAHYLATWLGKALGPIIHSTQTAFLKRRHIGDTILLQQLAPHALNFLSGPNSPCIVAFLDFRKAYDTVSQPFLIAIMWSGVRCGSVLLYVRVK
jgi:hypothetical protein